MRAARVLSWRQNLALLELARGERAGERLTDNDFYRNIGANARTIARGLVRRRLIVRDDDAGRWELTDRGRAALVLYRAILETNGAL